MKSFSQYEKSTGRFTSHVINGCRPQDDDTHSWCEGVFDHSTFAIDLGSGAVIPIERSARPDPQRQRRRVLALLAEIERKQARRVREILAESDPQLKAMDDEAAGLRAQL